MTKRVTRRGDARRLDAEYVDFPSLENAYSETFQALEVAIGNASDAADDATTAATTATTAAASVAGAIDTRATKTLDNVSDKGAARTNIDTLQVNVFADGAAFAAKQIANDVPAALVKLGDGRAHRYVPAGDLTADPSSPLDRVNVLRGRWKNVEDSVGDDCFANIVEAFTETRAELRQEKSRFFETPISTPPNFRLRSKPGVKLRPAWAPTGAARNTPMMTLGAGFQSNRLDVAIEAGLSTIKTLVQLGDDADIGYLNLSSVGLNNNRTASGDTDNVSGAVVVNGSRVRLGGARLERFDTALAVVGGSNHRFGPIDCPETIRGVYIQNALYPHFAMITGSGPNNPAEPNSFANGGRGIMTPGANLVQLAGCTGPRFGPIRGSKILEHVARIGRIATGTTIPNFDVVFYGGVVGLASYGCVFKCDDGDDALIDLVEVHGIYGEDVGNGNWFGLPGFVNFGPGGNANNNDGNKQVAAVRNSSRVRIYGCMGRKSATVASGYNTLWIERCNDVVAIGVDAMHARDAGILTQSGRTGGMTEVKVEGKARYNGGAGWKHVTVANDDTVRGLTLKGESSNNAGAGVEIQLRPDGTSPFATTPSLVDIRSKANTGANFTIPLAAYADADIQLENVPFTFTPSLSFSTTQGDIQYTSNTSTGIVRQRGDYVRVEVSLSFTPVYTTAPTGNFLVGNLQLPSVGNSNVIELNALTSFAWNSRTQLVARVEPGQQYMIIRGYASSATGSPLSIASFPSGTAVQITLVGEYRVA